MAVNTMSHDFHFPGPIHVLVHLGPSGSKNRDSCHSGRNRKAADFWYSKVMTKGAC